jgi:hypothetical protein
MELGYHWDEYHVTKSTLNFRYLKMSSVFLYVFQIPDFNNIRVVYFLICQVILQLQNTVLR